MSRVGAHQLAHFALIALVAMLTSHRRCARASEFPERECCDPIYPIPEPTSRAPSAPTPTGRSGPNIKTPVAILNCLYARQLCFEDASCSAILQIIPRVCGPELVACSTVTVTKCQAALHTLQAFPFFRPTCLCKEPHVDPECNSFQNFLFDHPCVYVLKKDKDPYPIDALLTCNHAVSVCQREKPCYKLFDDFKTSCRVREGKCRMESRDACHDAWTQLRLSPMFGCICPKNQIKKRCDKIFSAVNHNPCVDFLPSSASVDLSGTDSALYPFDPQQENFQEIWLPPTSMYPYFLFPDVTGTGRTSYYDSNEGDPVEERRGGVGVVGGGDVTYIGGDVRHRRPPQSSDYESGHREQVPELPGGSRTGNPRITVYAEHTYEGYAERDGDPEAERAEPGGFDRSNPPDDGDPRRGIIYDHGGNKEMAGYDDEQRRRLNEGRRINLGHDSSSSSFSSSSSSSSFSSSSAPNHQIFPNQAKHDDASSTEHHHPQIPNNSRENSHDLEHHQNHHQHQNIPYHRHRDRHNQHQKSNEQDPYRRYDDYHVGGKKFNSALAPSRSSSPNLDVRHPNAQSAPPNWHRDGNYHGTKAHAPRPTYYYEHGVVVGRFDDHDQHHHFDNDGSSRSGHSSPVDRLFDLREAFDGFVDQVKIISHPDNSTSFEVIESQLENPLIDADHQDLHALKQLPLPGIHHRPYHRRNHTGEENDDSNNSGILQGSDVEGTIPRQPVKLILSSTCHHAYTLCKNDTECRGLLQPVLNHCDVSSCARNECMNALQHFYKKANHRHSMEIAFCLCKKTEDKRDECIVAQEKMHPACAQRVELAEMPTCHSLAEVCREDKSCRNKLEHYEQSCAVDSVTKKCAGPPADCRKAMLGILGTELRSNCACKGTDFTQLYDCLGWQRLLWVNPCVVESQKDYHARKKHHHYVHQHAKTTTATPIVSSPSTTASTYFVTTLEVIEAAEDNIIPEVTRGSTTQPAITTESITMPPSTTPSTTTTTTTPPRFCVVQRPRQTHQYIREGKGKRLYRDDEPECSELCQCGEGEVLVCNTICVESSPCKTDFAFYNHAAPAYQAYRGRCLCYSGRFICMRPSPEAYSIPHGIFMFLGYSEMDETLLRPHNNLTVLDAVNSLDNFMREEANNQTVCTLFLYNVTKENVIAVARLGGDSPPLNSSQSQSLKHLLRVKEQCSGILQNLSDKINSKHQEVHTHPLMSIFKMAEVEVKLPQGSFASDTTRSSWLLVLLGSMASLISRSRILLSATSLNIRVYQCNSAS